MTRTDRIIAALTAELEKHRPSIDADDGLQAVGLLVKCNDGGYPRYIEVERKTATDLTARPLRERPYLT